MVKHSGKNYYFRTYFLYMIRYNNISRPLCPKSGVVIPNPQDWLPCLVVPVLNPGERGRWHQTINRLYFLSSSLFGDLDEEDDDGLFSIASKSVSAEKKVSATGSRPTSGTTKANASTAKPKRNESDDVSLTFLLRVFLLLLLYYFSFIFDIVIIIIIIITIIFL